MRKFINSTVENLKPSGIRKFFDIASLYDDVISLGVGEPDFETPWHIREEGIYALERGKTIYTSNSGLKELRLEICKYTQKHIGVSYDFNNECLVTVGGSEAIDLAMRSMIESGDEVIVPEPSYVAYTPTIILAGGKPVIINLKEENEFRLTKEELEEKITDKTKILVLPFPNNPTGAIMEYDDLKDIAEVCIKHDIMVVSDEIYSALTYKGKHISIASIDGMKERCIMITGFSKAFSMTGWRLGYACGPKEVIKQMTKIHQFCIMCAPTNSQYAAIEALKNGEDDVLKMREAYDERRRFLINEFKNMGIDCFEPYGAFYVFPNIKKFGLSSDEFATKLLEEEHVVVVPGTAFGDCGEGFLRISYAYSIESLKKALERIKKFIEKLNK